MRSSALYSRYSRVFLLWAPERLSVGCFFKKKLKSYVFITSSHLLIFSFSHLHFFTSSHLHIFTSSHLTFLPLRCANVKLLLRRIVTQPPGLALKATSTGARCLGWKQNANVEESAFSMGWARMRHHGKLVVVCGFYNRMHSWCNWQTRCNPVF